MVSRRRDEKDEKDERDVGERNCRLAEVCWTEAPETRPRTAFVRKHFGVASPPWLRALRRAGEGVGEGNHPTSKVSRGIFILTDSVLYDNQRI